MSKKSKIFYQIHECVFPCSHNSFKNARLWAYTEEEVKQAYKMHLDNSGNHSFIIIFSLATFAIAASIAAFTSVRRLCV